MDKYPYLLAEKNGEVLGYAYADSFHERAAYNWAVETSVYIKMDKRKLGIEKILYNELENILKTLNAKKRPLLKNNPQKLYDMYEERHELYLKYADVVVVNGSDFKSGVQNVYDAVKGLVKQ